VGDVIVHLVDGTYELYRQYYGQARHSSKKFAAVEGVLASTRKLVEEGTGPVGVATDHVIESFRNDLYDGYKTSEGMEPDILEQIPVLEDRLRDIGVTVWSMVEFEADDALASAARIATQDPRVHQVRIYSPDKDLAQCVSGRRVVQVDRRSGLVIDEQAVVTKYGIPPVSIPDYLALVGDSADGYPGVRGWGSVSTIMVLAAFGKIDRIPLSDERWRTARLSVRSAANLVASLQENTDGVRVFLALSTLVTTLELFHGSQSREEFLSLVY
jgi:5'-3' exonuclease